MYPPSSQTHLHITPPLTHHEIPNKQTRTHIPQRHPSISITPTQPKKKPLNSHTPQTRLNKSSCNTEHPASSLFPKKLLIQSCKSHSCASRVPLLRSPQRLYASTKRHGYRILSTFATGKRAPGSHSKARYSDCVRSPGLTNWSQLAREHT